MLGANHYSLAFRCGHGLSSVLVRGGALGGLRGSSIIGVPTGKSSKTRSGRCGKQWWVEWCTGSAAVAKVMKQYPHRVSVDGAGAS